jgi:hypothetical protein
VDTALATFRRKIHFVEGGAEAKTEKQRKKKNPPEVTGWFL